MPGNGCGNPRVHVYMHAYARTYTYTRLTLRAHTRSQSARFDTRRAGPGTDSVDSVPRCEKKIESNKMSHFSSSIL